MIKAELLAPAGDLERMRAAVHFGADAIYMGGPGMHLRAGAAGLGIGDIRDAAGYCHAAGKRLYVAVNAFARNSDFARLGDYIKQLSDAGADALIISDLGVLAESKRAAPDMETHISTQANCLNYESAKVYHGLGADRIVLGRELSLEEIARMRAKLPKELKLEAFVHGSMCMAYSGRCLISSYLAGRDSNRGGCAQPCRWKYQLCEESRRGQFFPVEEDERGSYILSSYDLNMIEHLEELSAAGVSSFKIEGRMKSTYYVATAVNAYRRAMDGRGDTQTLRDELSCASHRKFCTGFYFGPIDGGQNYAGYRQECTFVGVVLEYRDGYALVQQRNKFSVGERLEILSPHAMGEAFAVEEIRGEDWERMDVAGAVQQSVWVKTPAALERMDMLRRRDKS